MDDESKTSPAATQPASRSALRFAANLGWLFTELPFEQRFEAAARAGFSAVELPIPYDHTAHQIRDWTREAGLPLVLINAPVGPADTPLKWGYACLPDQITAFRASVERGLDYAAGLDAPLLHILGGVAPADLSLDQALDQFHANIAWAADQAAGSGVRLVLEPINRRTAPRFVLANLASAVEIINAVGAHRVGLLFDVFHVQSTEGNLIENFQTQRELISHIQIADLPGRHEPGTGEINYTNLLGAVQSSGYSGWVGCEYHPRGSTVDGLGWLKMIASGLSTESD